MDRASVEKYAVINRVSKTLNNLMKSKSLIQELDPVELTRYFSHQLLKNRSVEQVMAISEDELSKIIKAVMLFEVMYELLEDLSLEEMEIFDAALSEK
ncbi:MAG: hypothetical protein F6K14_22975 [Symploca sp. SIO2C1]|nr:hypothetical protein [Symploca sp. SIO2C1]